MAFYLPVVIVRSYKCLLILHFWTHSLDSGIYNMKWHENNHMLEGKTVSGRQVRASNSYLMMVPKVKTACQHQLQFTKNEILWPHPDVPSQDSGRIPDGSDACLSSQVCLWSGCLSTQVLLGLVWKTSQDTVARNSLPPVLGCLGK